MKKYLRFSFDGYYPLGGMGDFRGSFDSLDEAITACKESRYDYDEIYDRDTEKQVWQN